MEPFGFSVDRSGGAPRIAFAEPFNLAVPLLDRRLAQGRGEETAIAAAAGETVTRAALAERAGAWGNALLGAGIAPGARLLTIVKDCPEFVYLFLGAVRAGIVPVPVNTLLRAADYRYMIDDSECAAVVWSPEFAAEAEAALAGAAHRPALALPTSGPGGFGERAAAAPAALDPRPSTAEADCFWLYSSGSTGRPKAAVHRQRDLIVSAVLYAGGALGMTEADTVFSAAKLFFAYGLGAALAFPLVFGARAVLSDARPTPESVFDTVERLRPTIYFGVPTLYAAQCRALAESAPDLSSLRLCVSAGEALPAPVFRRWKELTGLAILDGIGSTEATHIFISNRPGAERPGTAGEIVPGYEARIVREDGSAAAPGESGRLWVRGPSVAARYWRRPDRTAAAMSGGDWLDTGDTFSQDADGYFVYRGRSDDMIKVGGIWCSPVEIETRLVEHPAVRDAAVVGRADGDGLTKPEAHVVPEDPAAAGDSLARILLDHCKAGLAPYKYPRWLRFVDELPRTATGKVRRFKLREGA